MARPAREIRTSLNSSRPRHRRGGRNTRSQDATEYVTLTRFDPAAAGGNWEDSDKLQSARSPPGRRPSATSALRAAVLCADGGAHGASQCTRSAAAATAAAMGRHTRTGSATRRGALRITRGQRGKRQTPEIPRTTLASAAALLAGMTPGTQPFQQPRREGASSYGLRARHGFGNLSRDKGQRRPNRRDHYRKQSPTH